MQFEKNFFPIVDNKYVIILRIPIIHLQKLDAFYEQISIFLKDSTTFVFELGSFFKIMSFY